MKIISEIKNRLLNVVTDEILAEQEAWWLLEKASGKSKAEILAGAKISALVLDLVDNWISERVEEHKPLQYILGSTPFCNITILCKPPTLIPRPETEEWVTWLLSKIKNKNEKLEILDLCSGSGAIALALAKNLPQSFVTGVDISELAVELSNENKKINEIENVLFLHEDMRSINFGKKKFDIIVSNPPYLSENEWVSLSKDVTKWEDQIALVSGDTGLEFYEVIASLAKNILSTNTLEMPKLVLEIGVSQAQAITDILKKHGFATIEVHKDLEGKDRWVVAN